MWATAAASTALEAGTAIRAGVSCVPLLRGIVRTHSCFDWDIGDGRMDGWKDR